MEFPFSRVELVLLVLPDGAEVGEDTYELTEIDPVFLIVSEEGIDNPVSQRVYR